MYMCMYIYIYIYTYVFSAALRAWPGRVGPCAPCARGAGASPLYTERDIAIDIPLSLSLYVYI